MGILLKLKNAKRGFNIEIVHSCTKAASSKLLLDTVFLFAAPSLFSDLHVRRDSSQCLPGEVDSLIWAV